MTEEGIPLSLELNPQTRTTTAFQKILELLSSKTEILVLKNYQIITLKGTIII